uniref:MFS domain-containing protein n=1 Tax=Steinernema glaseri TaxID=37863 RepID=A0A1I8AQ68_9BILA
MAGLSLAVSQCGSLGNTIIRLPLAIVPIFLVEHCGRRPLMVATQLLALLALVSAVICIYFDAKFGAVVSVSALFFSTSIGIGCLAHFNSTQLAPSSLLLGTVTVLAISESLIKTALLLGFFPLEPSASGSSLATFLLPSVVLLVLISKMYQGPRSDELR